MPASPDLEALERVLARMTPGPLFAARSRGVHRDSIVALVGDGHVTAICANAERAMPAHDAAAIVALVNAAPALLARCRELERALLEAADKAARGERGTLTDIDRWRALAHPGPAAGEEG